MASERRINDNDKQKVGFRLRIFKAVTKTVDVVITTDILCNKCGLTCFERRPEILQHYNFDPEGEKDPLGGYGLIEAEVSGAYDSPHLFDLCRYMFSICEKCLCEFFETCKIKPTVCGGVNNVYLHDDGTEDGRLYRK